MSLPGIGIGGGARVHLDDSNCIVIQFDTPTTVFTVTNADHVCMALQEAKSLQPVNDALITADRERERREAQP